MGRLNSIWNFIRAHKYAFAVLIFLLIIGVLDENSLYVRYQRQLEISRLQEQIDKYAAQYEADTRALNALLNDPTEVERMARERYYMKRPNEDVFVLVDEDEIEVQQPLERPADHPVPKLPGEQAEPQPATAAPATATPASPAAPATAAPATAAASQPTGTPARQPAAEGAAHQ